MHLCLPRCLYTMKGCLTGIEVSWVRIQVPAFQSVIGDELQKKLKKRLSKTQQAWASAATQALGGSAQALDLCGMVTGVH
jgi:ERCC4-related helicase